MPDATNEGTQPTTAPNPDKLEGDYDARAVKLLRVRRRVGQGTVDDPVRIAVSLWTEGGELIHEIDPARQSSEREELLEEALAEACQLAEIGMKEHPLRDSPGVVQAQRRIAQLRGLL